MSGSQVGMGLISFGMIFEAPQFQLQSKSTNGGFFEIGQFQLSFTDKNDN